MLTAAAFLALLDAVIISAAPNTTRIAFALAVTAIVGVAILRIWRSNTRIEKAANNAGNDSSAGNNPPGTGRTGKKRRTG
jgi:hypothetical protein